MSYRRKLIEVALPLDAINREAAREKSIRHGHPSTLHLWWARRPLAACRAVLFASLVDDPDEPDAPPEYLAALDRLPGRGTRRDKLFRFIEELVKWENSNDDRIIGTARRLILAATEGNPPPVLDPFCGGGSIPLEAQRLGLEVHASDLNPVAVLITKALVEIPSKFAGRPPVHPAKGPARLHATDKTGEWRGATGLAEDLRYYGQWMREEAERRIGHLYPKGPKGETVIAWLWARTVKCPNPACGAQMPLVHSFALSTKKGKEVSVRPVVNHDTRTVHFEIVQSSSPSRGTVERRGAVCICCKAPVPFEHVRAEGKAGRMGAQLMAVVAEGDRGRTYMPATSEQERPAADAEAEWKPDTDLPEQALGFRVQLYGMTKHADLFTPRQLVALTTFSDLVGEARERVKRDAIAAGLADDGVGLEEGGTGAQAYADAVATYLAFAVDKAADYWSTIATWMPRGTVGHVFARQALPMAWDFPEANPFSGINCGWDEVTQWAPGVLDAWPATAGTVSVSQVDVTGAWMDGHTFLVATDPPYYDNIGYADLSDYFYVWLRRALARVFPSLCSTVLTPKSEELVATPHRFGGDKAAATAFFEEGLGRAFVRLREAQSLDLPMTLYYAFKQAESEGDDAANGLPAVSTGWETMLRGLLQAGFRVTGTWPIQTERTGRMIEIGTNALSSSIVLACRPRPEDAPMATRREFIATLRKELPPALALLTSSAIAPVDLAQATIGPGMAVFSRYSKVLEADGTPMSVRTALQIINQELDAYLAAQEGDLDTDTRFCVDWFSQYGLEAGDFGQADVLARAKNTSVEGLVRAGVLAARGGKVRLLRRDELPEDWDPATDGRTTVWECTQHLVRALDDGGEKQAGALMARLGSGRSEEARELAYRLYSICDRKGWSEEARAYNSLVVSWQGIQEAATRSGLEYQSRLLDE